MQESALQCILMLVKCPWLADASHSSKVACHCIANIELEGVAYSDVKLKELPNLCSDVILGHDFLGQHFSWGPTPPLKICGLAAVKVHMSAPALALHRTVSRLLSSPEGIHSGKKSIEAETICMLREWITRPSNPPWRAQAPVTSGDKSDNHKKRIVRDYSQTINRYTELDVYPLPRTDKMVNDIARYNVRRYYVRFQKYNQYHQVEIR